MKKTENGYVGIIFLLLSVAIVGFLFSYMYMTPKDSKEGEIGRTDIQKAEDTIQQASKEADAVMELHQEIVELEI